MILTRTNPATIFASLVLAATFGCASSAPQAVAPAPVPTADAGLGLSLEPTPAELRAAQRAELTGEELGRLWTFDEPPLAEWKTEYGFAPSESWLDRVRMASLRFGEYCSASFVSEDGLVMTNQHCARECVEAVSSGREDYVAEGFYASSLRDERLCPGLFIDQLTEIEDVTDRVVRAVSSAELDAQSLNRAIREAAIEIQNECEEEAEDSHCQIVPLYQGAQYALYRYRRYSPVKLVFVPELQAAYFGGEFDNFTYPRYALDFAFVRVYDGERPATTEQYLPIDEDGAAEGETIFVVGNPGSTSRLFTLSQVMYERAYRLPLRVWVMNQQRKTVESAMAANDDLKDELRQDLFELSNALKGYGGMLEGLRDTLIIGTKIRWEQNFRSKIASDGWLQEEYGDVWDRLAEIQRRKLDISPRLNARNSSLIGSPHLDLACLLVEFVQQTNLPQSQRAPRFRGEYGRRTRIMLESDVPVDESIGWLTLTSHLEFLETWVPASDPLRRLLLRPGESIEAAAERLLEETGIEDLEFRRDLIDGGLEAIEASDDPLIVFARRALAESEALWVEWEQVLAEEAAERRRLGRALVKIYGSSAPPDATFTLRLSDGVVKRYMAGGTFVPATTTFYGLFARAAEFDGSEPWALPASIERARSRIDMDTPLDFVSTADITGGNSGSPVVDTDGRLVGVVFDSNIEQLPNEYLFRSGAGRTVAVHSSGILEALRSVYRASTLVSELTHGNRNRRQEPYE